MIDTSKPLGRAVTAALRLAEKRAWREISLLDIADEAGLTLADLSQHVTSKAGLLRAFARLVDDEVLRKAERGEPEESLRERLFDVLMTRFEAMTPFRAGLKRIVADATFAPELVPSVMTSQAWMLAAAGIPAEGPSGTVRIAGLASVYAATFRDWLADDDPGLAKTMAALDRRLRRGEGWMKTFDAAVATGSGIFTRLRETVERATSRRGEADRTPRQAPTPSSPPQASASELPNDSRAVPEPPNGSSSVH